MKQTIVVAGASGNLGGRIVKALVARGAAVRALVRPGTGEEKIGKLEGLGATVVEADPFSVADLAKACAGAACVVSAIQGLREAIVDAQSRLLDAAVAAGVPRFIPSDYSSDFTKLSAGENRNFDLRRAFHERLDSAPIRATSVFNGAFAELLVYAMPLVDFTAHRVSYWGSADRVMDFTTMDDTAAFTAAAALDPGAPRYLRIAGSQVTARELAAVASEITGSDFELVHLGTVDDLAAFARRDREADPASESEIYPRWQSMQYMHGLASGRAALESLDNDRYPGLAWTSVRDVLARR